MVLVDSSVWIDFFGNAPRPQVDRLAQLLQGHERVLLGDLVLAEVLQVAADEVGEDAGALLAGHPGLRVSVEPIVVVLVEGGVGHRQDDTPRVAA